MKLQTLKHKYLICLWLLFTATAIEAQEGFQSSLQFSSEVEVPKSEDIGRLLIANGSPYLANLYHGDLIVHSFEEDAKPLYVELQNDLEIQQLYIIDELIYVLSKSCPAECQKYSLFGYSIQDEQLTLIDSLTFTIKNKALLKSTRPFFVDLSDHAKTIVGCRQSSFKKDQKAQIQLVIRADSQLMTFSIPMAYDGDDFEIQGVSIDEQGMVYIAAKTGIKLNSPFRRKFLIFSFDPFSKELTEFDLSSDELFTQQIGITTLDKGATITGVYSTDPMDVSESKGYIYVRLTSDAKEIETKKAGAYVESMVKAYQAGDEETTFESIEYVYIQRTEQLSNDVVVLEQRYVDQVCTTDPRTGLLTCTDQYHFNGITVENVMDRTKSLTIMRRQIDYEQPSIFTSHSSLKRGDWLYFLYNDHPKNERIVAEKIMNNPNRSVVRVVRVNAQAEYHTTVLTEDKHNAFALVPQAGLIEKNDGVWMLLSDGKRFKVGTLSWDALTRELEGSN